MTKTTVLFIASVCLAIQISYSQSLYTPQPTCLIADYPFSGNANDMSVNSHHGLPASPTLVANRVGQPNTAYHFNGSSDHIELNQNLPIIITETFTITVWAKMDAKGGGINQTSPIFVQRDNSGSAGSVNSLVALFTDYQNNQGSFMVRSATPSNPSPVRVDFPILPYQEWHFYAAVMDSSLLRLYIDSVEIGSAPFTNPSVFYNSIDYVEVGRHTYNNSSRGFFDGTIDDLQIYDCALNEKEILEIYENDPSDPNAIDELRPLTEIVEVYPNPTSDFLSLTNKTAQPISMEILSMHGVVLESFSLSGDQRIDLRHLPNAVYLLRAKQGESFWSQLLMKQD